MFKGWAFSFFTSTFKLFLAIFGVGLTLKRQRSLASKFLVKSEFSWEKFCKQALGGYYPRELTPKVPRPLFCSILKFGQAILVRVLMLNF